MDLISLIVVIVVVGLLLWLTSFIPLDPRIRQILQVVVVVALVLWIVFQFLGAGGIRLR